MIVVIDGKLRRFVGNCLDGKMMTEWRLGERIMWPNPEGVARRIVLELPQHGTLDWVYWVHSLDATRLRSAQDNYLKFTVDDIDYFIGSSYDGTNPYTLDDNVLTLDVYDGAPIDKIGAYLDVNAVIRRREGEHRIIREYEQEYSMEWDLPLLPKTQFEISLQNYSSSGKSSYGAIRRFCSLPSNTTFPGFEMAKHQRVRITDENAVTERKLVLTDTRCGATAITSGGCYYDPDKQQYQYAYPVFPSFRKSFVLKVISIS